MSSADTVVQVVLCDVPVAVWARAQQHADELLREFALMAARMGAAGAAETPARLTQLVEQLSQDYGALSADQEARLSAAAAAGVESIPELIYHVPADIAGAVSALGSLLDEADEYCRAGRHLLTLASPPELVAFRNWYLDEFRRQVAGEAPLPWPSYQANA